MHAVYKHALFKCLTSAIAAFAGVLDGLRYAFDQWEQSFGVFAFSVCLYLPQLDEIPLFMLAGVIC